MIGFLRQLHNRRPLLWTIVAFVMVMALATTMSVWWNYLLIQNHHILRKMTAAAAGDSDMPLAILMIFGLACSLMIVLGLLYMFLRLIREVQLNLAQSQFIAAVTHELRSPVASLQLMLDTIRDPTTPLGKRQEFEQCMHLDLLRLRGLVDQVLDTARLENFFPTTTREAVSLDRVLRDCINAVEVRLKMSAGRLTLLPVSPDLLVRVNPRLLTTAIGNVLDNALKYSQGAADISLDVSETGRSIMIDIRDKGIGISRAEQKRIFKRFYRARDLRSSEKPGTGLGLYFAKLALKAQGGNISVQSGGLGLGTTFRIEVPKP